MTKAKDILLVSIIITLENLLLLKGKSGVSLVCTMQEGIYPEAGKQYDRVLREKAKIP